MKDITTQTKIERAITLPSKVEGFKDRDFVIMISSRGLGLRKKGDPILTNFMDWDEWANWMYAHPRTKPMPRET